MLKLFVMQIIVSVLFLLNFFSGWFSPTVQLDLARIVSPKSGDALQGTVEIRGTVTGIGFQYAEVNFQNSAGVQDTWFFIAEIEDVIVDDVLALWDTSIIADGEYALRVIAYYEDGHTIESIVENVRIRNYTAIEPLEIGEQEENLPLLTATEISASPTPIQPTPTNLPPNELALDERDFLKVAGFGALFGTVSLIVIGFLLLIRTRRHG